VVDTVRVMEETMNDVDEREFAILDYYLNLIGELVVNKEEVVNREEVVVNLSFVWERCLPNNRCNKKVENSLC
jgi:hypothetical protein